ncbi:transporter substrate-binding domain-containing protein [Alteromonas pelagimontana]|uniref:Transporter substrate-binding domain-containing protein n=1 Tax=Alteromonas pelagimontana TaxID=1858656 RepID=A0A6M4MAR9_9ALTE|nr:transporter substrate-binding domain-containing protein [Alteromonas pelagimontana]QJR80262.1 transporter substrate-binding domain-containing protein [Alteromonas pelagimontana]
MRHLLYLLFGWLVFAAQSQADTQKIVYTQGFDNEYYGSYQAAVLHAVLGATADFGAAEAVVHPQPMTQARQILTLLNGEADVMWCVTSDEREKHLIPVRFPLIKGLAGKRVLIIKADKQKNFPSTLTLQELKRKTAVQGIGWPDLDVLSANGFTVTAADWSRWSTAMFIAVEKDMVDYFPRNVIEVFNDLELHNNKQVTLEKYHILSYPNYEYFFVSPHKPELVKRVKTGLARLVTNGELEKLFNQHKNHAQALKLVADPKRVTFKIINPHLSYELPHSDWLEDPDAVVAELLD